MRSPLLVVGVCAVIIVGGLFLAMSSSTAGAVIAMIGFVGFGAFLVFAQIKAALNSPGLYVTPGKARREWKAEQEAARLAEQRKAERER